MWDAELEMVRRLVQPSSNALTDLFGPDRLWGGKFWTPESAYSPIHAGIDYSSRPDKLIDSPADGWAWGEIVGGSVGSYTMIRPLLPDRTPTKVMLIYLIHCEPTGANWRHVASGDLLTKHAGHGIGAPHLHYEIAVTAQFGRVLQMEKVLSADAPFGEDYWKRKAKDAGLKPRATLHKVRHQIRTWGISEVHKDYLVRGSLPTYRRSRHSEVGDGETWVVDSLAMLKRRPS